MEKNAKIVPFFYKEQKRTQRSERSFEKNGCPTLVRTLSYMYVDHKVFKYSLQIIIETSDVDCGTARH